MSTKNLSRHYEVLGGAERFVAVLEAMARGDLAEEQRLDDSCPRATYKCDDPEYRSRMSVSFTAAALVCASIQRDLDVLRVVSLAQDLLGLYEHCAGDRVEDAFLAGWQAARAAVQQPDADDDLPEDAQEQVRELREQAERAAHIPLAALARTAESNRGTRVLSAWEGFGRFTRECCGVEPLVLTKAWRLLMTDPVEEVLELFPEAKADPQSIEAGYTHYARSWRKRFGEEAAHVER